MKTIEQFKKEFDDKFNLYTLERGGIGDGEEVSSSANYDVKNYIFQELLPQVLSEILPKGTIIEENIMNKYKEFLNSK